MLIILAFQQHEKLFNSYLENVKVSSLHQHRNNLDSRANAVIIILCRNTDLDGISKTIQNFEHVFNSRFKYPYVFLNDKAFTMSFRTAILSLNLSGSVEFGLIPTEHWSFPQWIDQQKAESAMEEYVRKGVIYGGLESYRHMCRFNSGFFFRHPLILPYQYYWRIEPDVEFFCPINYDPFIFMQQNGKKYGFTIALEEIPATVPTLWKTTLDFIQQHYHYIRADNNILKLFTNSNATYNMCHFWSHFEIADMTLWRSEAYLKYFDWLDMAGGFFYERWGDAPVHSLAVGMFLGKDEVHWFEDIGYLHYPFMHCPRQASKRNCTCKEERTFDWSTGSCLRRYLSLYVNENEETATEEKPNDKSFL